MCVYEERKRISETLKVCYNLQEKKKKNKPKGKEKGKKGKSSRGQEASRVEQSMA